MSEPTPSVGGYIRAAVVAVILGSFLIAAIMSVATENVFSLSGFLGTIGIIGVVAALAAIVLGFPLAALAHFQLRDVRPQWVHAAAFGCVGAVLGVLAIAVLLNGLYAAGVSASLAPAVAVAGCQCWRRVLGDRVQP